MPLPLVVMQVLAIDLGTSQIPAMALGAEPAEPGTMTRPPRPRSEHLLNGEVGKRIALAFGPLEGLAAMASFFFAYVLAGWQPWDHLAGHGSLYVEAIVARTIGVSTANGTTENTLPQPPTSVAAAAAHYSSADLPAP